MKAVQLARFGGLEILEIVEPPTALIFYAESRGIGASDLAYLMLTSRRRSVDGVIAGGKIRPHRSGRKVEPERLTPFKVKFFANGTI